MTNSNDGILIIGGTSDIGREIGVRLCRGRQVVLAARRAPDLQPFYDAGATKVHILYFEAADLRAYRTLFQQAEQLAGEINLVLVAFGVLGDQQRAEVDEFHAADIATIDYTAQIAMLTVIADELRPRTTRSTIVAFSSIAGWRPRRANYVYGSAKAGLDAFCQGLTDALHGTAVRVITVRPGFVIGSMTHGMKPAPMSVTSAEVADILAPIIQEDRGSRTVWIPRKLQLLAALMRLIPRRMWRRMPR